MHSNLAVTHAALAWLSNCCRYHSLSIAVVVLFPFSNCGCVQHKQCILFALLQGPANAVGTVPGPIVAASPYDLPLNVSGELGLTQCVNGTCVSATAKSGMCLSNLRIVSL